MASFPQVSSLLQISVELEGWLASLQPILLLCRIDGTGLSVLLPHAEVWFALWLLCLQCLICQPNDGHSCLHASNAVSPSVVRRRQDVFLIETFTSNPSALTRKIFWSGVEDTHPSVADTP